MRDLRVGDALHAAEYRVHEDDAHADHQADVVVDLEEARERDADALHLADNVRHRRDDEADDGHDAGGLRVVAITDELGHRELAELAQVRCEQHCEQHVAAGPAHQEQ